MSRVALRARYIQGWYEMDGEKLVSACAENFIFDDPAEPQPVARDGLIDYMHRWSQRTQNGAGSGNQWKLAHEVRQDSGDLLTDWEWWEVIGTRFRGMALVITSDQGVLLERITYFDRDEKRV